MSHRGCTALKPVVGPIHIIYIYMHIMQFRISDLGDWIQDYRFRGTEHPLKDRQRWFGPD